MRSGNTVTDDIRIEDVDWENDFFRISSVELCSKLADSINAIGIINQPYLIFKQNKYVIISGFRRMQICRELRINPISVKILDPRTSDQDCAKVAIFDNTMQRPLNLMEQSRSYALLEAVCKDDKTIQKILSTSGLSTNPSWIRKSKSLLGLPTIVQEAVEKEVIPLAIAQMFSEMEEEIAIFLTHLFQDLTIGLNKQREIIQMASEIAKNKNISLKEFFFGEDLSSIIEDPHLDKNKKTFKIRQWLKEKRFPHISHEQNKFEEKIKALKLGDNVRLIPPPFFEGKTFTLSLAFSSIEELRCFKDTILRLEKDDYLTTLLQR